MAKKKLVKDRAICRMIGCHNEALENSIYCEVHDKEQLEMPVLK